jgi:hypothetical protein
MSERATEYDRLKAQKDAIVARERERLEAIAKALMKYGRHETLCAVVGGYDYGCTCGFDAAMALAKPELTAAAWRERNEPGGTPK